MYGLVVHQIRELCKESREYLISGQVGFARRIGESFNDWGERGYKKYVPVLGGDGTKIATLGDLFDQPPGEMN